MVSHRKGPRALLQLSALFMVRRLRRLTTARTEMPPPSPSEGLPTHATRIRSHGLRLLLLLTPTVFEDTHQGHRIGRQCTITMHSVQHSGILTDRQSAHFTLHGL